MEVNFLFEPTKICVEGLLWLSREGFRGGILRPYAGEGNGRVVGAVACALYGNALKRTAAECRLLALFGRICGAFLTIHGMFRRIHPMEMAIHGMDFEFHGVFRRVNSRHFVPYRGEKRAFRVVSDLNLHLFGSLSGVSRYAFLQCGAFQSHICH